MKENKSREVGLSGSLKDFGLAELLQILGQQQKSGVLTIQGEKKETVQILFHRGMIVGTLFPEETGIENSLGQRLIRGGLITAENWKKAYAQHQEELKSVDQVLLKNEMIRHEDLAAIMRLIILETIYNLFKWPRGNFQFIAQDVYFDPTLIEPLNTEYLLLDVLRMIDEWPLLAKKLPSFDIVFQKVDPLATLEKLNGTPWEKRRSFQMEVIYELVNGVRSISEIIDLSFIGEFDTCKNLVDLWDAGLIEPLPRGEIKKKRRSVITGLFQRGLIYLLIIIWVLILIYQFGRQRENHFPFSRQEEEAAELIQNHLKEIKKEKLERAKEIFFLEENRLPQDLRELTARNLFPTR